MNGWLIAVLVIVPELCGHLVEKMFVYVYFSYGWLVGCSPGHLCGCSLWHSGHLSLLLLWCHLLCNMSTKQEDPTTNSPRNGE